MQAGHICRATNREAPATGPAHMAGPQPERPRPRGRSGRGTAGRVGGGELAATETTVTDADNGEEEREKKTREEARMYAVLTRNLVEGQRRRVRDEVAGIGRRSDTEVGRRRGCSRRCGPPRLDSAGGEGEGKIGRAHV